MTNLHTDTTTDAELLGDGGNLVVGGDLNTQLAHPHHRAALLALLPASLGLASVRVHDGNARLLVSLIV